MDFDFFKARMHREVVLIKEIRVVFWDATLPEVASESNSLLEDYRAVASIWRKCHNWMLPFIPAEKRMSDEFFASLPELGSVVTIELSFWRKQAPTVREFLLRHEVAHLELGHLPKIEDEEIPEGMTRRDAQYMDGGFGWKYEREADALAASQMGLPKCMLEVIIRELCGEDPATLELIRKNRL